MGDSDKANELSMDVSSKQANIKRGRHEFDAEEMSGEESEIKTLLLALMDKIDTMNDTIAGNDDRLNAKIEKLESALNNKIQEVKNDMESRVQSAVTVVDKRIELAEIEILHITKKVNVNETRMEETSNNHESRIDRLERLALEKDLIISGIPLEDKDDPFAILGDICRALKCNLKSGDFSTAFRLRSGRSNARNNRTLPIVIRVQDDWVKQELLTAYFKKQHLNLTDIGFKSPTRIYINERLTSTNRAIFNRAAEAKKANVISRFYTRRGLVTVQRDADSKPRTVLSVNELEMLTQTVDTTMNDRTSSNTFSNRSSGKPAALQPSKMDGNSSSTTNNNNPSPNDDAEQYRPEKSNLNTKMDMSNKKS